MAQVIENRKAKFNYNIISTFSSGILLIENEIKSIRDGKISFLNSFCGFNGKELFLKSCHISHYGKFDSFEETRDRKLLLTKSELRKLKTQSTEKGFTIIPLKGYFSKNNLFKIEIALCKSKNTYDKKKSTMAKESYKFSFNEDY